MGKEIWFTLSKVEDLLLAHPVGIGGQQYKRILWKYAFVSFLCVCGHSRMLFSGINFSPVNFWDRIVFLASLWCNALFSGGRGKEPEGGGRWDGGEKVLFARLSLSDIIRDWKTILV